VRLGGRLYQERERETMETVMVVDIPSAAGIYCRYQHMVLSN